MSVNKNIFFTFLSQAPTLLFGFITSIFVTRMINADGVGVVSIFQNDIELFALLLSFSVNSAFIYFMARQKIDTSKLLGIGTIILVLGIFLLAAFLAVINLFFSESFVYPEGHNSLFYTFYLLVVFALSLFNSFISSLFQGQSLFKYVNFVSIFTSVMNLTGYGLMFILSTYYPQIISVKGILLISMGVVFINTCVWLYFYARRIGVRPAFDLSYNDEVKPVLVFISLNHLNHLINFMNYRLDLWIVDHYHGSQQVGYYARAVNVSQLLWVITVPIANVLVPYLCSDNTSRQQRNDVFAFFSRLSTTTVLGCIIVLTALAQVLLPLVYGDEFINSVLPFRLLLSGILFSCMSKIFSLYPYAMNKVKYNLVATAIGLTFTVTLDMLLIPRYGIVGASIASLASYAAIFTTNCFYVFYVLKVPVRNYFIVTPGDIQRDFA